VATTDSARADALDLLARQHPRETLTGGSALRPKKFILSREASLVRDRVSIASFWETISLSFKKNTIATMQTTEPLGTCHGGDSREEKRLGAVPCRDDSVRVQRQPHPAPGECAGRQRLKRSDGYPSPRAGPNLEWTAVAAASCGCGGAAGTARSREGGGGARAGRCKRLAGRNGRRLATHAPQKTVRMSREVEAATPGGRPVPSMSPAQREAARLCSSLGSTGFAVSDSSPAASASAASAAGASASSSKASSSAAGALGSVTLPGGWRLNPDPTEQRTGVAPPERAALTIQETVDAARALLRADMVKAKKALSEKALEEARELIRGALVIAYPMGFPDHEPVKYMLAGTEDVEGLGISADLQDEETSQLWWAGKEFVRGETVGDRVGRNEKTKVIVRLQKKGGGPPVREPAISEDERRAMMATYFKKQQELKELAENDDDAFLSAKWADPKSLKRGLVGSGGDVRFR
jgi:hypothetical protein